MTFIPCEQMKGLCSQGKIMTSWRENQNHCFDNFFFTWINSKKIRNSNQRNEKEAIDHNYTADVDHSQSVDHFFWNISTLFYTYKRKDIFLQPLITDRVGFGAFIFMKQLWMLLFPCSGRHLQSLHSLLYFAFRNLFNFSSFLIYAFKNLDPPKCVYREMNMGLINKGWYGIFVACEIWCLADVSSVIRSSEQTSAPTGDKRTISTFVDQTHIQHTGSPTQKNSCFSKLVFQYREMILVDKNWNHNLKKLFKLTYQKHLLLFFENLFSCKNKLNSWVAKSLMSHTFAVKMRVLKHTSHKMHLTYCTGISGKTYLSKPYHYSQLII